VAKFEEVLVKFVEEAPQILDALKEIEDLFSEAGKVVDCLSYLKDFVAAKCCVKIELNGGSLYILSPTNAKVRTIDLTQFREKPLKELLNAIFNDDTASYLIASECYNGIKSIVQRIKRIAERIVEKKKPDPMY
jgi:hypothetical protein